MASYDMLKDELYKEVERYRHREFRTSLMTDISIRADTESRQITFGHPRRIGYTIYHIAAWAGPSTDLAVRCRSLPRPVIDLRTRAVLHSYLDEVGCQTNPLDQMDLPQEVRQIRAWIAQREWWAGNGKVFELFRLPPELRLSIYEAVCNSVVQPYPHHRCRYLEERRADPILPTRPLSLLTLSRQVNAEACSQFFIHTTFRIEHMAIWNRLVRSKYFVKQVRRVDLALSLTDFMFFFVGMSLQQLQEHDPVNSCVDLRALRRMRLTHLTIRLPDISKLRMMPGDPICYTQLTTTCLQAAWPHIKGHSGIHMTGIAHREQAAAFHQACKEASSTYAVWQANALTFGYGNTTLAYHDRWLECFDEEEDGGVSIGSVNEESKQSWRMTCDGDAPCICTSPCPAASISDPAPT